MNSSNIEYEKEPSPLFAIFVAMVIVIIVTIPVGLLGIAANHDIKWKEKKMMCDKMCEPYKSRISQDCECMDDEGRWVVQKE